MLVVAECLTECHAESMLSISHSCGICETAMLVNWWVLRHTGQGMDGLRFKHAVEEQAYMAWESFTSRSHVQTCRAHITRLG